VQKEPLSAVEVACGARSGTLPRYAPQVPLRDEPPRRSLNRTVDGTSEAAVADR